MKLVTFRKIEQAKEIAPALNESPLSGWYARMRDIPLSTFGIEDLCKSVRQNIYPEYVIPVAVEALEINPMSGEMYDGELAMSFRTVSDSFWRENPGLAERVLRVLNNVVDLLTGDLKADAAGIIARIDGITKRLA